MIKHTNINDTRNNIRMLYLTVFISGMTTLAIELSASRLLGSVFGASNFIWANIIGLMLLYLTIGYFIGGRWADRSPYYETLYKIILWGAFLSGLIPLIARPILQIAATAVFDLQAALAVGSFVSVLILFSVPITLLGCVSPFAIRLAITDSETVGKVSGQIYAISTLGSLIGTFLPVFILIPTIGTARTFLFFAATLYTMGFLGLWQHSGTKTLRWLWMPIMIFILAVFALNGPLRAPAQGAKLLYDKESGYNYIQVQEDADGYRYLYLNDGQGVHSIWHATDYAYEGTWDMFLAAPFFNAPPYQPQSVESLLVIGLATGTIPRQYIHVYGDIPIDGVEIDPKIIEAGELYFDMNKEKMPTLTVHVQDGRYVLNQLNQLYSVVAIDAYRPPYIPWHLTTVEFFTEVKKHLLSNGVVAINVGRTSTDRRLVEAMTRTLLAVFPTVHTIDVPRSFNTILVASMQPTAPNNLMENYHQLTDDAPALLRDTMVLAANSIVPTIPSDMLFTDDKAPVDMLADALVLNFLLNGNLDEIR